MKIYPEKVWIDVDSKDKPFILHNEATMGMCAYIRSDLAHPEPTGDRMAALERAAKLAERLKKVANLHPDHSYTPLGAYKCSRDRGMIDPYGYLYEALSVIEALTHPAPPEEGKE